MLFIWNIVGFICFQFCVFILPILVNLTFLLNAENINLYLNIKTIQKDMLRKVSLPPVFLLLHSPTSHRRQFCSCHWFPGCLFVKISRYTHILFSLFLYKVTCRFLCNLLFFSPNNVSQRSLYISSYSLFTTHCIPLNVWGYSLINQSPMLRRFGSFLQILLQWVASRIYMFVLLGMYLQDKFLELGCKVKDRCTYSFINWCQISLSKNFVFWPICMPTSNSCFPQPCEQNISSSFEFFCPSKWEIVSQWILTCIYLNVN